MGFIKLIKFTTAVYHLFIGCYVRKIKNGYYFRTILSTVCFSFSQSAVQLALILSLQEHFKSIITYSHLVEFFVQRVHVLVFTTYLICGELKIPFEQFFRSLWNTFTSLNPHVYIHSVVNRSGFSHTDCNFFYQLFWHLLFIFVEKVLQQNMSR